MLALFSSLVLLLAIEFHLSVDLRFSFLIESLSFAQFFDFVVYIIARSTRFLGCYPGVVRFVSLCSSFDDVLAGRA
jgi:hypothetical protein